MKSFGELTGRQSARVLVKSPVLFVPDSFALELLRNDVPTTLYYKTGVKPWKSILINNVFEPAMVPKGSDIYIAASVNSQEIIQYSITY